MKFNQSTSFSTAPSQLIHSDLWGLAPELSCGGFRYYLIFIDDFSKYTWIFPLIRKSETFTYFCQFKLAVENQFGTKIKCFQSSGGLEYDNKQFFDFFL